MLMRISAVRSHANYRARKRRLARGASCSATEPDTPAPYIQEAQYVAPADPLAAQPQPFVSADSMPSVAPPGVPMDGPPQGSQNSVWTSAFLDLARVLPDGLMYKNYLGQQ